MSVGLDRGQEADLAEVDREDRHARARRSGAAALQDRAVAAQDQAQVGVVVAGVSSTHARRRGVEVVLGAARPRAKRSSTPASRAASMSARTASAGLVRAAGG